MMNIKDKIEEIKQKPEHVRIRYAWGLSFFCTLIIVIIWLITLVAQKDTTDDSLPMPNQEILDEFQEQKTEIEETGDNIKKTFEGNNKKTLEDNQPLPNQKTDNVPLEEEGFGGLIEN
ncbi:MAG TPA: hypothetical protein PLK35_03845 [Candidatus Moranbacteria bacterium]|nr:hypothetical protein [Candidatus Moranbacteria bacterium]